MQHEQKDATAATTSAIMAAAPAALGSQDEVSRAMELVDHLAALIALKIDAADVAATIQQQRESVVGLGEHSESAVRGFFDSHPAQARALVKFARMNASRTGIMKFIANAMARAGGQPSASTVSGTTAEEQKETTAASSLLTAAVAGTLPFSTPPHPLPTLRIDQLAPLPSTFTPELWAGFTQEQRDEYCMHLDVQRRFKLSTTDDQQCLLVTRIRQEPGVHTVFHSTTLHIFLHDSTQVASLQHAMPSIMDECGIAHWQMKDFTLEMPRVRYDGGSTLATLTPTTAATSSSDSGQQPQPQQQQDDWRDPPPDVGWWCLSDDLCQLSTRPVSDEAIATSIGELPASIDKKSVRAFFLSHHKHAQSFVKLSRMNATPTELSRFVINTMNREGALVDSNGSREATASAASTAGEEQTADLDASTAAVALATAANALPHSIPAHSTTHSTPTIGDLHGAARLPWTFASQDEFAAFSPQQQLQCCAHLDLQRRFNLSPLDSQQLLLEIRILQEPGVRSVEHSEGTVDISLDRPEFIDPLKRQLARIMAECGITCWYWDDFTFDAPLPSFDSSATFCTQLIAHAGQQQQPPQPDWRGPEPVGWHAQQDERLRRLVLPVSAAAITTTIDMLALPPSCCDREAVRSFFDSHPSQAHTLVKLARMAASSDGLIRFVINTMESEEAAAAAAASSGGDQKEHDEQTTWSTATLSLGQQRPETGAASMTPTACTAPTSLQLSFPPQPGSRRIPAVEDLHPLPWLFASPEEWEAWPDSIRAECCLHVDVQRRLKMSSVHREQFLLETRLHQEPGVRSILYRACTLEVSLDTAERIESLESQLPFIMAQCDIELWWKEDVTFKVASPMRFDSGSR